MIRAIGAAMSGLSFFKKKLDVSAQNIANLNTDGYKKRRVESVPNETGQAEFKVTRVNTPGVLIPGCHIRCGCNLAGGADRKPVRML